MTLQVWRNLGYLLCLVGLWLGVRTMDGNALSLRYETVAQVAFLAGAAILAVALIFDWVDQTDKKDKK